MDTYGIERIHHIDRLLDLQEFQARWFDLANSSEVIGLSLLQSIISSGGLVAVATDTASKIHGCLIGFLATEQGSTGLFVRMAIASHELSAPLLILNQLLDDAADWAKQTDLSSVSWYVDPLDTQTVLTNWSHQETLFTGIDSDVPYSSTYFGIGQSPTHLTGQLIASRQWTVNHSSKRGSYNLTDSVDVLEYTRSSPTSNSIVGIAKVIKDSELPTMQFRTPLLPHLPRESQAAKQLRSAIVDLFDYYFQNGYILVDVKPSSQGLHWIFASGNSSSNP